MSEFFVDYVWLTCSSDIEYESTIQEIEGSLKDIKLDGNFMFQLSGAYVLTMVLPSPLKEKIKALIEWKAKSKLYVVQSIDKKQYSKFLSLEKSYLSKNFPKKLGDQFCEHLLKKNKCCNNNKLKRYLKDKASWHRINRLLTGVEKVDWISTQSVNNEFLQFLGSYQLDSISHSKVQDLISIIYYKVQLVGLRDAAKIIQDYLLSNKFQSYSIMILKSQPELRIQITAV